MGFLLSQHQMKMIHLMRFCSRSLFICFSNLSTLGRKAKLSIKLHFVKHVLKQLLYCSQICCPIQRRIQSTFHNCYGFYAGAQLTFVLLMPWKLVYLCGLG
uniref:Uncharacterized protein n=1 Tax=Opuntia streptacantha TaxID=393608 RepID=A0A7C9F181_OPUST